MAEAAERTCYRHPDRVTGLSCSECGRPICTECMTPAPVGIRCPDHSGKPQGAQRIVRGVQRAGYEGTGIVTRALIALNVAVWALEFVQTGHATSTSGSIFEKGFLFGPFVRDGDWWRLITAAFLHYGPIHLFMNMLALYWFGTALEMRLGAARYLLLYLVSGLGGSAGALLLDPNEATVGASGAIFGILGAGFVLERQRDYVFGGSALAVILINLVFTFSVPNISIGGHVGGLVAGAAATLGLSRFGRGHAAYGRLGVLGVGSIVAVGVISIAVSYWRVHHLPMLGG
jgi:membrane associated rhomboid family serine protease